MKVFLSIFVWSAVEATVRNIMPIKESTSTISTSLCPAECDKPRLFDRNCLSCHEVPNNGEDKQIPSTSATEANTMSCLYWQDVCIKTCSEKKPESKNPPSAFEIYLCENKCRVDWYCILERYDAEHNNHSLFRRKNAIHEPDIL